MLAMEGVAKSPEKKGTTKDTMSTKEKKKLFFVLFVSFVVQGFYAFCDNLPLRKGSGHWS